MSEALCAAGEVDVGERRGSAGRNAGWNDATLWAPLGHFPVPAYFRDWQVSVSSTNGSSMLPLMHPNFWQISEGRDAADDHTITLARDRTGLCIQLRRITARKTLDAPLLTVLLTKVHLGTKEFSFDFHTRDTLWTNITQRGSAAAQ